MENSIQNWAKEEFLNDRLFVLWSNALLEWKAKKIPLPEHFEILLRYKLGRYGMKKIVTENNKTENSSHWNPKVDRILNLMAGVRLVEIEDMEEHLNDECLMRLRLILIELNGLMDVEQLRTVPIREMAFCLAVFILMSLGEARYVVHKFVLLPVEVMRFLRTVVAAMQAIRNDRKDVVLQEQTLEQFSMLEKCFCTAECLYNIERVREYLTSFDDINGLPSSLEVMLSLVIGKLECISFKIPKLDRVFNKIVNIYRYSEKCGENKNKELFIKLLQLKMLMDIEYFIRISEAYQHFLGCVQNCRSLKQLKILSKYIVSAEKICDLHKLVYHKMYNFYSKLVDCGEMNHIIRTKLEIITGMEKSCITFHRINFSRFVDIIECNVDIKKVKNFVEQEINRGVSSNVITSCDEFHSSIFIKDTLLLKVYYKNTQFVKSSNANGHMLLRELVGSIKSILENFNCSSIDNFLENYRKVPQNACMILKFLMTRYLRELNNLGILENESDLLKYGHQMIYGQELLKILTNAHPSDEILLGNVDYYYLLAALLIAESPHELQNGKELLSNEIQFTNIQQNGLNWVQEVDTMVKKILNAYEDDLDLYSLPYIELFNSLGSEFSGYLIQYIVEKLVELANTNTAIKYRSGDVQALLAEKSNGNSSIAFKSQTMLITPNQIELCADVWNVETFYEVSKKLIQSANVESLSILLTSLNKLLDNRMHIDQNEVFSLIRDLRKEIRNSLLPSNEISHLEEYILTFIFQQCRIVMDATLHISTGENDYSYFKSTFRLWSMEFAVGEDIWLTHRLLLQIVECESMSDEEKILFLKVCHVLGNDFWLQPLPPNLSVMSFACSKKLSNFLNYLMDWSFVEFREPQKRFTMIIQQCSVGIFELFLSKNAYCEKQIFEYTSSALQQMYVTHAYIPNELQMYLWYRLSIYGFDNLCSSSKVHKNPMDMIDSIKVIIDNIKKLALCYDDEVLAIDNEVLFHLRMVHNHLFAIKDKPHFKNIPMKEITYLIAIFLSSFHGHENVDSSAEDFSIYRMILNKQILTEHLLSISKHLEEFLKYFSDLVDRLTKFLKVGSTIRTREHLQSDWKTCHGKDFPLSDNIWNSLLSKKYSTMLNGNPQTVVEQVLSSQPVSFNPSKQCSNQILRLYHRVKQLYSLRKILKILQRMSTDDESKEVTVASLKRLNQILGESIKNTKNSQNLPKKMNRILNYQLRDFILIVKKTRDITCHDYPLVKKYFSLEEQYMFYARIKATQVRMLSVTVAMLLICTYSEYWRCFFVSLRRCRDLNQMKSLVRFIGNLKNLEVNQVLLLDIIVKYHDEIQQSLNVIPVHSFTTTELNAFERIKKNHSRRLDTIEKLREIVEDSFTYKIRDIKLAIFSSSDVECVHRLLRINLLPNSDYDILHFIENSWVVLDEELETLSNYSGLIEQNVSSFKSTLYNLEINRESMQEYHCRQEIRKIVETFSYEGNHDRRKLEFELSSRLEQKKYFNNIFLIDDKINAVKNVFEKQANSAFSSKMLTLRKNDISELEQIFKSTQQFIMNVYERYDCSNIELLIKNCSHMTQEAILAIEYWLMELCEILISTGQFQDNFHTIKHDLQMICGRNFRNYLAHDGLSYDILTCSSRAKVLINGLVMAKKKWNIFENSKPSSLEGILDSRAMGPIWLKQQKLMIESILNSKNVVDNLPRDFRFPGRFWMPKGRSEGLTPLWISELVHNSPTTKESALKHFSHIGSKSMCLDSSQNEQQSFVKCFAYLGEQFNFLEKQGNYEELLQFITDNKFKKIAIFLLTGSQSFLNYVLNYSPSNLLDLQTNLILLCKPVDQLKNFIQDESANITHLKYSVIADHIEYFIYLLGLPNVLKQLDANETEIIVRICARYGRLKMIQIISDLPVVSKNLLDLALSIATKHQHWKIVSFLYDKKKANPWNYMNEFYAANLAIKMGSLGQHFLKKFLKSLSKSKFNIQSILPQAVEFGSVGMVKFLIEMGCDIWQNQQLLLLANSNRRDDKMLDLVENLLFKYKDEDATIHKLSEWKRIVHEWQLLNNFSESSRIFLQDYKRSKKILKEIVNFGKMNDGYSVRKLESCAIKCNDPRIKVFRSIANIASFDINMQCLSPKGSPSVLKVLTENVDNSSGFISNIVLDIFNAEPVLPHDLTLSKSYTTKPWPISVCYDLIKLIDNNTQSSTILGQFELENQLIRFIRVGSCLFIADIAQPGTPTYVHGFFNSINRRGDNIFSNLHTEVDKELIEILLSTGVDLTIVDRNGKNGLMLALDALFSWEVLRFMLEYSAQNNIRNPEGVHIFDMKDRKGCTLLQYAALIRRLNVVEFLLQHGADQLISDNSGMFPMHYAVLGGSLLIVDTLIDHNKDLVNFPQRHNRHTPLMMAVNMNNSQMVHLLLQRGADINIRCDKGETAVTLAIALERFSILKEILNHGHELGIDVTSSITEDHQSALQYTMLQDNVDIFKIVLEHMVGCSIDDNMNNESLVLMKKLLLTKDSEEMDIFGNVFLLRRTNISNFLKECENLYMNKLGASLREAVGSWQSDLIKMLVTNAQIEDDDLVEMDDLD